MSRFEPVGNGGDTRHDSTPHQNTSHELTSHGGTRHDLVIEYGSGCYQARCQCNGWRLAAIESRVSELRRHFSHILREHRRHLAACSLPARIYQQRPPRPEWS